MIKTFLTKITHIVTGITLTITILLSYQSKAQREVSILKEFNEVTRKVRSLEKEKDFENASISFYAIDIMSGDTIVEHNADMSLVPASVMKLVTTSAALEILGPDFRFNTQLQYAGNIKDNILYGNVYIKGGGDPTFGSERFKQYYYNKLFWETFADSLKKEGIDSINGSIIGDASRFEVNSTPPTWIWGDLGNYFGAAPCALSIFENSFDIYLKSGSKNGDPTHVISTEPEIPYLELTNYVKSSNINRDLAYIFGSLYDNKRTIFGSIPKNRTKFKIKGAIPDPPYYTALCFTKYLNEHKLGVSSKPSTIRQMNEKGQNPETKRKTILNFYSPPLKNIITQTNQKSINLYAEHLLNEVGRKVKNEASTVEGTKTIEKFWEEKGVNTSGFYMNDGSGLSRYNAITTRFVVEILRYMKKESAYSNIFYNSLAVGGQTGTVKRMFKNTAAEGNIRAKSGYMNRVRSYAGYVTTVGNRKIAFAIIINNYNCTPGEVKKKMEELMISLADLKI